MKFQKSHFWYNKNQRNGIFFLLLCIILLQFFFFYIDFSVYSIEEISEKETQIFKAETDSLQKQQQAEKQPKIFPFNPNYINDFRGYRIGMNIDELNKLYAFRKKGKFVNSAKEFQKITGVSDSLLKKISPYFKFPEWVVRKNKLQKSNQKTPLVVQDINKATAEQLRVIYGIGEKISKRIIAYRTKLQGFSYNNQIYEVWGLDKTVAEDLLKKFQVQSKPTIQKININTATFKQVLKIVYIDYQLCKRIFEYRDEVAELQSIEELKNIDGFPLEKFKKITLYLIAE